MTQPMMAFTAVYLKAKHGYVGFVEELPGVNSQGRTIDYAALEQNLMKYRDLNFVHLAPILKEWLELVAARK